MDDAGAAALTVLPPTGPDAVAAARERRDRRLRAFVAADGGAPPAGRTAARAETVRTGSRRSHEVGSRADAANPCGSGAAVGIGDSGARAEAAAGVLDGLPIAVKGPRGIARPAVRPGTGDGPPGTVAWSADLGVVTDLDDDVVAVARAAADRLVAGAGLVELPAGLRLRDAGPAWFALRSPDSASGTSAAAIRAADDRALAELSAPPTSC